MNTDDDGLADYSWRNYKTSLRCRFSDSEFNVFSYSLCFSFVIVTLNGHKHITQIKKKKKAKGTMKMSITSLQFYSQSSLIGQDLPCRETSQREIHIFTSYFYAKDSYFNLFTSTSLLGLSITFPIACCILSVSQKTPNL